MLKQKLLRLSAIALFGIAMANSVFAIDIYYKDKLVPTDTSPVIEDGRTLVPISSIAKSMNADVSWNSATKTATIVKDNITIEMVLGSKNVNISKDGKKSQLVLDVAAKAINGRTMVPVRAVSEIFGSKVLWDKETESILIDSSSPKKTESTSPKNTDTVSPKDGSNLEKIILSSINGHRMAASLRSFVTSMVACGKRWRRISAIIVVLSSRQPAPKKCISVILCCGMRSTSWLSTMLSIVCLSQ